MGILDEAIKEHLELKRQHGAEEPELKQLEDEAFGAAERPGTAEPSSDPAAEAPTEFMVQPDLGEAQDAEASAPEADEAAGRPQPRTEIADLQEAPAMEHEAVVEEDEPEQEGPEPSAGHSTEERHAIAEQPTEMFDVEEEFGSEAPAPTEEELVEEEMSEPRLAPVDPLSGVEEVEEKDEAGDEADLDEEFWDEKRLSDELDQALEAPYESEAEESEPGALGPPPPSEDEPEEAKEGESPPARAKDEDVLEETPDFLEEAPEDDQLWFEQKPPKDFDFDD